MPYEVEVGPAVGRDNGGAHMRLGAGGFRGLPVIFISLTTVPFVVPTVTTVPMTTMVG